MKSIRTLLKEAAVVPGEAPGGEEGLSGNILAEPGQNDSGENEEMPNIYELYPDLESVDVTSPCNLADFFASLCEEDMADKEESERSTYVPSLNDLDSEEEF